MIIGRTIVPLGAALLTLAAAAGAAAPPRPNVLVILADDLGFSDLGASGGEIDTPHLDALAAGGLRFTQGYDTARCWPSRAALLTGYYAQAVNRDGLPGGLKGGMHGTRPPWARLLPELLAPAGYRSYHSGKWHVDGDPRAQGFARSLQVEAAAQSNYFTAAAVTRDGRPVPETPTSYVTTLIGDHAVESLREHAAHHQGTPFFHYVAFTAPHFPLHAPAELIAKYRDRYRAGWDAVRAGRIDRLARAGIVTTAAGVMERGVGPPYPIQDMRRKFGPHELDRPLPWADLTAEQQAFQAEKMAIHAAMVEAMDREVGRIVAELKSAGLLDDTFILFASDNGASAEILVRGEGHDPAAAPGSRKTFLCLGPGWSSCANAPFRRHKTWVHEGGIATPWIVHWPRGIAAAGALRRPMVHLVDVTPTVLELAGLAAPAEYDGAPVPPMHGRSFLRVLGDPQATVHEDLWWCHDGHRAVRVGDWKLVAPRQQPWELYDLAADRCETTDLAATHPERVRDLEARWRATADECVRLATAASRTKPPAATGKHPPLPLFDGARVIDADVTAADQATLTARYTQRAVDFIMRSAQAADGRPFFLSLAHTMPHVPLFVGEAFRGQSGAGLYGDVVAEIDASVGAVLDALVSSIDVLPTLAAFTGDALPVDAAGSCTVAGPPPSATAPRGSTPSRRRPNVIYVMTDDQGYGDIAAHGNRVLRTPHLDRLWRESVRFTEFHASPTCAPTRAALMTGRHEFRSGVTHTIGERERLALSATTLPQLLRAAGYTTGIFGKWHLGDEDEYQPGRRGFDRVFIHGGGGIGQSYPGSCGDAPGNGYFDPWIRSDGTFVKTQGYCTDVFFTAALEWIDRCRTAHEPFFCYVATNAPHYPFDCPPGADTPYLPALEAAGITDATQRATIAKFYGMIENIDTNIGRLLAQLDAWGLAEDTLVVFTTDNGTAAGDQVCNAGMRGKKGTPWRGGTRVPAFWRWKGGLPAGVDVPALTAHIDVLPTLCELTQSPLPEAVRTQVEGRSLVPLLRDPAAAWPDRPLVTHVGRWDRGQAAASALRNCRIREGRWSLVNVKNDPRAWELYDLAADPSEARDVATDHPEIVGRLAGTYATWWDSVQADLVNEDRDGPAENPFKAAFRRQQAAPGGHDE